MFRKLKASEIDVRVATVKQNGLSLLLYKDARCDMNVLDETVGPFGWKREHLRDNKNCIVSLWDDKKSQWVSKEDTGTESYSEAEKGLASDSFKRACFNWGIGRELYTGPFIWVTNCDIKPKGNGFTCYDRFCVESIGYDELGNINELIIANSKTHNVVYELGKIIKPQKATKVQKPTSAEFDNLVKFAEQKGITYEKLEEFSKKGYKVSFNKLNKEQYDVIYKRVAAHES